MRVEPRLKAEYVATGAVRLGFHHILDHGRSSEQAALAAECAGEQSPASFWAMHDLLFSRLRELSRADAAQFTAYAGEIGLDQEAFGACMVEQRYGDKIRAMDERRRSEWGVRRRPSFLINGRLYEGGLPFEAFAQAIQAADTRG